MTIDIFSALESDVRSYSRSFPCVFDRAKDAFMFSEDGHRYIDFFAGAGALNYGHNNEYIKKHLLDYLEADLIVHGLDLYTTARHRFLTTFSEQILQRQGLTYKLQTCGPTGTNAVEAALKLARKVTGRAGVFSFMGGFHGMTLGSLATTGDKMHRAAAGVPLPNVTFVPFPVGFMDSFDTIEYLEALLQDDKSGIETPAAILVETVQAEGGVYVASISWLRRLEAFCKNNDILLICDDIQVGCGRTGPFFSFERAGIVPHMVTLSKSLSGYGLPLSLLLLKPEFDVWSPGEHNGTFRGNQLGFIAGAAALAYRDLHNLEARVKEKGALVGNLLEEKIGALDARIEIRGLGLIWGIDLDKLGKPDLAKQIAQRCFALGLIIERAGRRGQTLKLLPPLIIETDLLEEGINIIQQAFEETLH